MSRSFLCLVLAGALSLGRSASAGENPSWRIHGSASSRYTVSAVARDITFIESDSYNIAQRDHANLFNDLTNDLVRKPLDDGEEVVITARHPRLGTFRRTLISRPGALTYRGRYDIQANAMEAEIAYVSLYLSPELVEGAEWVAETDEGETNGVLPDAEPRQNIVVGLRRIQFQTALGLLTFSFTGSGPWTLDDLHGLDWAAGRPYRLDLQLRFPTARGLRAGFEVQVSFEPRTPSAEWFSAIDISKQVNVGFRDETAGDRKGGWIDHGPDDLHGLMPGEQRFLGVPFRVIDPIENKDKSAIVLQGADRLHFPLSTPPISVNAKLRRLYFLHCCAWAGRGQEAGQYAIEYEDGSKVNLPLRVGSSIADWWAVREPLNPDLATAWEGENDACPHEVRLLAFKWDNPRPASAIKSITITGSGEGPLLCVVAITGVREDGLPDAALKLLDYLFVKQARELVSSERPIDEWLPINLPWQATETNDLDISSLLDAPAGRHGFVKSRSGHLYFEDGTRARFWGAAIGAPCAFGPHETAEKMARHLAQSGCNLVRIHGLQTPSTGQGMSLVDYENFDDSQHWNAEVLDRLDYFIAQLKKNGIYVYVDLLTRRRFREGDGLPGVDAFMDGARFSWGQGPCAKPVSTFNRRMIELQKEFATKLLTHENPYTGLPMANDPAIALIEITNENSMFWQTHYDALPDPYAGELRQRWNEWLLKNYGERDAVKTAWERLDPPLAHDEDPRLNSVRFRDVKENFDMARFAYEIMRDYTKEMVQHVRSLGVQAPITGHNSPHQLPDIRAVVDGRADFVSIHGYWELIGSFKERKPEQRSPLCENPFNPLVRRLALARTRNLPYVITEVNYCWPNEFRAEGVPIIAAYASLQDWDGVIWFSHSGGYGINTWDNWKEYIYYHTQTVKDPSVWGQFRAGAEVFLGGKVSKGKVLVENGYSDADCFFGGGGAYSTSPLDALVHVSRCQNAFFAKAFSGKNDLVISSALTPNASYAAAARAFLFAGQPFVDLQATTEDRLRPIKELYPSLGYYAGPAGLLFEGIGFDSKRIDVELSAGIRVNSIPHGSRAIGVDEARGVALGFINDRHCVVPDIAAIDSADRMLLYRVLIDSLDWWGLTSLDHSVVDRQVFLSDTGELSRDFGNGILTINTPAAQGAAGFIGSGEAIELKDVSILSGSPHASITLVSLDGKPLSESGRILVTAVADSVNTGQDPQAAKEGGTPVIFDPVEAGIGLRSRVASSLRVAAVDGETGRRGSTVSARVSGEQLRFEVGPAHKTIFYLITSD